MIKHDDNHRGIDCDTCDPNGDPTVLQAWISDALMEHEGVSTITEIDDDELRRLARIHPRDCAIEGDCYPCNGPDDGDDGNQDD